MKHTLRNQIDQSKARIWILDNDNYDDENGDNFDAYDDYNDQKPSTTMTLCSKFTPLSYYYSCV